MKILIIEDHQIYANGLKEVISKKYPESEIVFASNYHEVLDSLNQNRYAVIFLDINLNGTDMMKRLETLNVNKHDAKIIILSSYFNPQLVNKAKTQGINAYLFKNSSESDIYFAMESVLVRDEFFVSGNQSNKSIDSYDTFRDLDKLSNREIEIIKLLATGNTNSSVAEQLFISVNTVHTHRKNIYKKLNVNTIQELISLSYRYNLII